MLQKNKVFVPPVAAGTAVDFPNADPIFHNAFSSYDGQIFDVGLYPPGTTRSVYFRRACFVRVFCKIHAAMSAVILVLPTPYFATTAKDGTFRIDVPAMRERLFQPFVTAGKNGLGLALSRQTVLDHGGDLWIEDGSGGGARFRPRLPC